MRYNYKRLWRCDSCCDIEVHRRSDGKYVFIAREVPDNGDSDAQATWLEA